MDKESLTTQGATGARSPAAVFGAVVLNYNDYASTISCVESLVACRPRPRNIVVVDNDSPNDSLAQLTHALDELSDVHVVGSGFNGGYSYGNNVGIRRLRQLGCDHVIIATSDTVVLSTDLLPRLEQAIASTTGIVAPQIVSDSGTDNPSLEQLSFRYLLDLAWILYGMPGLPLRRQVSRLVRGIRARISAPSQATADAARDARPTRNVYKLHGAFLCLTDSFLSRVGELNEAIFMFGEEDLLAWQCLDNGLTQTLVADAFVRHDHDSSVNMTWGAQAQMFVTRHQKNSCRVLRKEIGFWRVLREWLHGS